MFVLQGKNKLNKIKNLNCSSILLVIEQCVFIHVGPGNLTMGRHKLVSLTLY